jgi:putative sterol carrier protein/NAD-dependent dihydropyrimidine dehydrogenase PreA subunit
MDYEAMRTASTYVSSAAVGKGYGQIAITAHRVAAAIRALGYSAAPCGNDTAMSVPLAIQAGLGELSRIGILVTPEYGPRVRICKVFTDLPLQADQPITFGVQEFCKTCLKCAEVCPAHVISKEREPSFTTVTISNNPGVKKWYNNVDNCFKYWSAKVDCAACIAACPYNKKNDLAHQVGLRIAQSPAKGLLRKLDELLGYGKTFDKKMIAEYWARSGVDENHLPGAQSVRTEPGTKEAESKSFAAISTPREAFEMLSEKFAREPEKLKGMNAVIQFHLKGEPGGPWFISVVNGHGEVGQGEQPSAGCTLTMQEKDFPLLITGKLDPRTAVLSGRISVKGDVMQLLKLKKLFG